MRSSAVPSLSRSLCVFGVTAAVKTGCGKLIGGSGSASFAPSVSPVCVLFSRTTVAISPTETSVIVSCNLPRRQRNCPSRSSVLVLTLKRWLSDLIVPLVDAEDRVGALLRVHNRLEDEGDWRSPSEWTSRAQPPRADNPSWRRAASECRYSWRRSLPAPAQPARRRRPLDGAA